MMEIKSFSSLEDLEFELLEEVKIEEDKEIDKEIYNLIEEVFNYNNLIKIVKIKDDKKIGFSKGNYYLIKDDDVLEIGYFVLIKTYPRDCFWKIDKEILDKEYLKKCSEKIDYRIDVDNDFKGIIDKKYLQKQIQQQIKEKKEMEREKGDEEKRKLGKDEETKKEKVRYEKESIGSLRNKEIEINKNEITYSQSKYILEENVNEFFKFEEIKNINPYNWRTSLNSFENKLINKKINYTKEKVNDNNIFVKVYGVEFGDELKVNGIKILKNKLNFILNRINENTTEEQIKTLNKLTGMKFDILNLKEIEFDNLKIEININLIDDTNFEIDFINKKEIVDWGFIKKYFFGGGSSRSVRSNFRNEKFIGFSSDIGLTKQELFDYLKRLKILKNLESENES